MSEFLALNSIRRAASDRRPSTLALNFDDPIFNLSLQFVNGMITQFSGNLMTPWSSMLRLANVPPASIVQAQRDGFDQVIALELLIERGYLTPQMLATLSHERLVAALLPLGDKVAQAHWNQLPANSSQHAASASAERVLSETFRLLQNLTPSELALTPKHVLTANVLNAPSAADDAVGFQIYQSALRGLNLGDIATRLPMRWDYLVQAVSRLQNAEMVSVGRTTARRTVCEQLQPGEQAPDFALPALDGSLLHLAEMRGQPIWLIFNRQATCALCNPHNAQIIEMAPAMNARGIKIVTIWGSSLTDLNLGIGRLSPPYPVLADPHDQTYDRYGLRRSVLGTIDARNAATLAQGVAMLGPRFLKSDGELTRMPAEFLINPDGSIHHAHYNAFGADWLPMERVNEWADQLNLKQAEM